MTTRYLASDMEVAARDLPGMEADVRTEVPRTAIVYMAPNWAQVNPSIALLVHR